MSRRLAVPLLCALLVLPQLAATAVPRVAPTAAPRVTATADATTALLSRTVPASGQLAMALPARSVLLGVTWPTGDRAVSVRVRRTAGWEPWHTLEPDHAAAGTAEASRVRPGTEPLWLGRDATAVDVRVAGAPGARVDVVTAAGEPRRSSQPLVTTYRPRLGSVVLRAGWGANESYRRGKPSYPRRVDAVVLHHTVTPNDYSADEAAAYVRSVYAYHTRSRGYDDIGYNLLVDRHGQVFEGRAGGFDRAVAGAHTAGFNKGTLGVALLGNFETSETLAPAVAARVAGAVAWAADRWGFDPRTTVRLVSAGSDRHARGRAVTVPRLAGHRDLAATACPGRAAYAALPQLRGTAWRELAPLFLRIDHSRAARPGERIEVAGELDKVGTWSATLTGPLSLRTVARADGKGTRLLLVWDGRVGGVPAPPGDYKWRLTASDVHGDRTADGTVLISLT